MSLLGEGGMASVYRAHQVSVERQVAIKVLKPTLSEREDFIRRFNREAHTVAALSHPHILKIFDFNQQDDLVYLVTEILEGGSLADVLRRRPLTPSEMLRILEQLGSALDYAHRMGVVHRDLKPQNVLLDGDGNSFLTDFGLAWLYDG